MNTALFQRINKFVSIEEKEFEEIMQYFTRKNVEKKALLIHIGDNVLDD